MKKKVPFQVNHITCGIFLMMMTSVFASMKIVKNCDPYNEFQCKSKNDSVGICIPMNKVCNDVLDCPESDDEVPTICNVNECLIENGGCQQICVNLPYKFRCECMSGFVMYNNECKELHVCDPEISCPQLCYDKDDPFRFLNDEPTNNSILFKCGCGKGYRQDMHDHSKCNPIMDYDADPPMLISTAEGIQMITLTSVESLYTVVNITSRLHSNMDFIYKNGKVFLKYKNITDNISRSPYLNIDFIYNTGTVFWLHENSIYKTQIGKSWQPSVAFDTQEMTFDTKKIKSLSFDYEPKDFAVDWIYNHIYCICVEDWCRGIMVMNFEGAMENLLIPSDHRNLMSIALDPIRGWMYWSDCSSNAKIERSGMDGTHREIIASTLFLCPSGLTLDLTKKRLYWTDTFIKHIFSSNFDGSDRVTESLDKNVHSYSLSLFSFRNYVYWYDINTDSIYKKRKIDSVSSLFTDHIVTLNKKNIMDLHLYHPYAQPNGTNYCGRNNGGCRALCLPAPQININSPKISCVGRPY